MFSYKDTSENHINIKAYTVTERQKTVMFNLSKISNLDLVSDDHQVIENKTLISKRRTMHL